MVVSALSKSWLWSHRHQHASLDEAFCFEWYLGIEDHSLIIQLLGSPPWRYQNNCCWSSLCQNWGREIYVLEKLTEILLFNEIDLGYIYFPELCLTQWRFLPQDLRMQNLSPCSGWGMRDRGSAYSLREKKGGRKRGEMFTILHNNNIHI